MSEHHIEIINREPFKFGSNWSFFLQIVSENRIRVAEELLKRMPDVADISGKTFLGAGFSLGARRLGARCVYCDAQSLLCTATLKEHYFPADPDAMNLFLSSELRLSS